MNKEIENFVRKMDFATEPTLAERKNGLFVVKWLWKGGKPIQDEEDADKGIIHQYSRVGHLVMEIMI